jgi:hypothetical protein
MGRPSPASAPGRVQRGAAAELPAGWGASTGPARYRLRRRNDSARFGASGEPWYLARAGETTQPAAGPARNAGGDDADG